MMGRTGVLAAIGAAVPMLLAVPAHAAGQPGVAMRFGYDAPQVSADGEHVTWHWTLRNAGSASAGSVTVTHHLTPAVKDVKASAPCEVLAGGIQCRYPSVAAGDAVQGTVTAALPPGPGSVQIEGRITWEQPHAAMTGD